MLRRIHVLEMDFFYTSHLLLALRRCDVKWTCCADLVAATFGERKAEESPKIAKWIPGYGNIFFDNFRFCFVCLTGYDGTTQFTVALCSAISNNLGRDIIHTMRELSNRMCIASDYATCDQMRICAEIESGSSHLIRKVTSKYMVITMSPLQKLIKILRGAQEKFWFLKTRF